MKPIQIHGNFPRVRLRRTRASSWLRCLVAENRLTASDLIWPLFVTEGHGRRLALASMPGVELLSIDNVIAAATQAAQAGIPAIMVFPLIDPEHRSPEAKHALEPGNLVCRAIGALKGEVPEIGVIADVALDPYTSHGHDGLMVEGQIANDETLAILAKQALTLAQAGADVLAPSDMMDGRIGVIREALDEAGYQHVCLCSYTAKYASGFYGPFRDALQTRSVGSKRTYHMDPPNSDEALREATLDVAEGADMLIVKPGLPYLDVLYRVKEHLRLPTIGYHASGEYAMWKAACEQGWIDKQTLLESLIAFKRAGAAGVITYAALEAAQLLSATTEVESH